MSCQGVRLEEGVCPDAIPFILEKHINAIEISSKKGDELEYKRLIKDLKLESACRFLGDISVSERDQLFYTYDIICIHNRNESFASNHRENKSGLRYVFRFKRIFEKKKAHENSLGPYPLWTDFVFCCS